MKPTPQTLDDSFVATGGRDFVTRLLSSLGAPADDLDDLAQESVLRYLRRGYQTTAPEVGQQKALLARCAYSSYLDLLRRRRYRGTEPLVDTPSATGCDPAGCIAQDVAVIFARAGVSAEESALLIRRFADGMTIQALAAEAGLHPNTIQRRLDRLVARLRRTAAESPRESRVVADALAGARP